MHRILLPRGVPADIVIGPAVLSATDILTAYLPVIGEHRGIAPAAVGAAEPAGRGVIACRLVTTPVIRLVGRTTLLTVTCVRDGLCADIALPVPVRAPRADADDARFLPGRRPAAVHDDRGPGGPGPCAFAGAGPAAHRRPPRPGHRPPWPVPRRSRRHGGTLRDAGSAVATVPARAGRRGGLPRPVRPTAAALRELPSRGRPVGIRPVSAGRGNSDDFSAFHRFFPLIP